MPPPQHFTILDELVTLVVTSLVSECNMPLDAARDAAANIVSSIQRELGGLRVYIPSGRRVAVELMRREIGQRWNGRNTRELCREFRISETRLRSLSKESKTANAERLKAIRRTPI